MNPSLLLSLGLVVAIQLTLGLAESSSKDAKNTDGSSSEKALSREKRGSYNMMRLGRGLRMLRLGKRSGTEFSSDQAETIENLLSLLEDRYGAVPEGAVDSDIYLGDYLHPRYRRSTPPSPGDVTVSQEDDELKVEDEDLVDQLGADFGEGFEPYPAEEPYGDWEGLYEPSVEEGDDEDEKRAISMLRLGRNAAEEANSDSDISKRPMSMLRLGKRPMSMLRLGKRPMSMLRLGKRPMSMLRLGKRPMSMLRLGKRPMSMLRLGKRPMSMLRLGKRPMSMLRLGKRPMSMLRLGKRPMSMLRLGKRPMSMLRLGKRPMSMLRLGKRSVNSNSLEKRDAEVTEDKRQTSTV